MFGPKWNEVTGEWRDLLNEEHYNLKSSPNLNRMIKSSENETRRACSMQHAWEGRGMHTGFWWESHKERDH
jgi:hypothetical protein